MQARLVGAGEPIGGWTGWWVQTRLKGAVSYLRYARVCQLHPLGKPPGKIPCQHLSDISIAKRPEEK